MRGQKFLEGVCPVDLKDYLGPCGLLGAWLLRVDLKSHMAVDLRFWHRDRPVADSSGQQLRSA